MPLHAHISALFKPASVMIVGASRHKDKIGNIVLANLLDAGYGGKIFPVNPRADSILGLPALGKPGELAPTERPLDLGVICLPAAKAPDALRELAAVGAKAAVIISAGFRETGAEGAKLEEEVLAIARESNMALLGPNSLGFYNSSSKSNVTFAVGNPGAGDIGFFSQSGALCVAIYDWAKEQNFGFSSFVSLGNKTLLDESDMLSYLADDPDTKVIAGYLESVENGPRFLHNAYLATRKKPVILLKAGRTSAGASAASSHTGALAGADMAYEAAFRQSGIIRARGTEELFGIAQAFAGQPLPKGPGLAIVSNAGGPAITATDAWADHGLALARLCKETITALKEFLPSYAALYNPVDVVSDAPAKRLAQAVGVVLGDPAVHSVLVLAAPAAASSITGLAEYVAALPNPGGKPVFVCLMGGDAVELTRKAFVDKGIPCYPFPEPAINAMAAMYRQSLWKKTPLPVEVEYRHDKSRAMAVIKAARRDHIFELSEMHAQQILNAYELPCLETKLARTSDEAVQIARELGMPVALKIASPHILHKTDVQGVTLGLDTPDKVRAAFTDITMRVKRLRKEAYIAGCLVQAMAPAESREVIIGFKRDKLFGPLITFSMGGVHMEAFRDVACRLAPLSLDDAHDMVREIKAFPVLAGLRGQSPVKFTSLEDILLIMSQIALDFPDIHEVECNPVLAGEHGAKIADIRIVLTQDSAKTTT